MSSNTKKLSYTNKIGEKETCSIYEALKTPDTDRGKRLNYLKTLLEVLIGKRNIEPTLENDKENKDNEEDEKDNEEDKKDNEEDEKENYSKNIAFIEETRQYNDYKNSDEESKESLEKSEENIFV